MSHGYFAYGNKQTTQENYSIIDTFMKDPSSLADIIKLLYYIVGTVKLLFREYWQSHSYYASSTMPPQTLVVVVTIIHLFPFRWWRSVDHRDYTCLRLCFYILFSQITIIFSFPNTRVNGYYMRVLVGGYDHKEGIVAHQIL